MKREEKGVESERIKQDEISSMVKKLKRGVLVSKRGGLCSTPPPIWRLVEFDSLDNNSRKKPSSEFLNSQATTELSARKLCFSLWEIESYQNPVAQMRKGGAGLRQKHHKRNGFEVPKQLMVEVDTPPGSLHEQPVTASGMRRLVSASLMQHHRSDEHNYGAIQPLSPTSCSSTMEVAPYMGRMGESSHGLKTSTELLKVLNRIWSLEEHHASNVSLVKELEKELDHSREKIKQLLHEKQSDRHEMDDLMKHVTENNLVWKNKDQDRIKATVQLLRDELEGERRLRKHSESLHRKLARQLSEVKSSFSNALRELERERKARILLENLCDEFANGIKQYEQEMRSLKQNPEVGHSSMTSSDRLILHISEAWIDERIQMKIAEAQNDFSEGNTIVDKLGFDIETFLQAKRSFESDRNAKSSPKELKGSCSRRHSLESFPLNISAPEHVADGDSTDSDSHCFEACKNSSAKQIKDNSVQQQNAEGHCEVIGKSSSTRKTTSLENTKPNKLSALQGRFRQHMVRSVSCNGTKSQSADKEHGENTEIGENQTFKYNLEPDNNCRVETSMQSLYTGNSSPVQQWMPKLTTPDFGKSESSLDWPPGLNENTLMAKLLEARLEAKRSRTKNSKEPF